ncbi:MAG: hypothetical protein L3J26_09920 [Candidatus Polarisedimenticolaceae bacterium]|nr:hypothetical protein [Candidatus Polarisedimenticolaceae bacterium]
MLTKNITRSAKIVGLACLLPTLLQATNAAAAENYTNSLYEVVRNSGEAGRDELCLAAKKATDSVASTGFLGKLEILASEATTQVTAAFFSKSVYCGKNIISSMLQTGAEIDLAVALAAGSLHSSLIALDYKEEDLHELARIKKAEVGTRFTGQALGNTESNSEVIQRWASQLSSAIADRKESPLGADAKKALAKAAGNVRGAIFHQTKALIGSYVIKEFIESTPEEQIIALVVRHKDKGLTKDFFQKMPSRTLSVVSNVGHTIQAMQSMEKVLDDSELKAIIEITGEAAIEQERKESLAVAKRIEEKSSFASLSTTPEQIKIAKNETKEPDANAPSNTESGGLNPIGDMVDGATNLVKKVFPW